MTSAQGKGWKLFLGDYREVLRHVENVGLLLTDPPYSPRTHRGHDSGMAAVNERRPRKANGVYDTGRPRRKLSYAPWTEADCIEFANFWALKTVGWSVILSDDELIVPHRRAWEAWKRTCFQDVPCVIRGMSVRLVGDGPSSWAVHANMSRPPSRSGWGTMDGAYVGPAEPSIAIGGKPLWLARALVRDYSFPTDLVVDPCAGGGTFLEAALLEGRECIGAEIDEDTFEKAVKRLQDLERCELWHGVDGVKLKQTKMEF